MEVQATTRMAVQGMNQAPNALAQANNNAANPRTEELQARRQEQAAQVAQGNQSAQAATEARANQANQTDQANRANQAVQLRQTEQDNRANNNIQQDRLQQRDQRDAANLAVDQATYAQNPANALAAGQAMGTILDMRA